jgi:hypothetical protein
MNLVARMVPARRGRRKAAQERERQVAPATRAGAKRQEPAKAMPRRAELALACTINGAGANAREASAFGGAPLPAELKRHDGAFKVPVA